MTAPTLTPVLASRLHLLEGLAPLAAGPPSPEDLARFEAFGSPLPGYVVPDVDVVDTDVPGPHGPVPVRIYRSPGAEASDRGLVWAHGGAFIGGDLDMPEADLVARELAARGAAVVVSVDYRLCHGEVHFPVPHDDVHAAVRWAVEDAAVLTPAGRWSVGGASAGGNLAAGVAQRLRDEGRPPSGTVLAYPVLHDPVPAPSSALLERVATLPPVLRFPPEASAFMNRNFLGELPSDTPYAFPAHGDLAGLPRTLVVVCEFDELAPSGLAYAAELVRAGVDVDLLEVPGVTHGHLNVAGLDEARATIDTIAAFLQDC